MKGFGYLGGILAVLAVTLNGCEKADTGSGGGEVTNVAANIADAKIELCGKCGEIKGTDKCCLADAEKCTGCNLAKGSPACCKHLDFSQGPVILCGGCGQVKGTEACCAKDAPKCEKCNLAKGSPGCCKISI